MCAVSQLVQGLHQYPAVSSWDFALAAEIREIIRRLDIIDQKLNMKNCLDEEKEKFLKQLDERIKELEEKVGK